MPLGVARSIPTAKSVVSVLCLNPELQCNFGPSHICVSFRTELFPEEDFVLTWKVLIDVVFKSIKADDRVRYGTQGKLLHYFIFEGPSEGMFR